MKNEINEQVQQVDLDLVAPDPTQPRKTFPTDSLNELAESIKSIGIQSPLVCRPWVASDGTSAIVWEITAEGNQDNEG